MARERLLQTRTMHALNTRDIRTGFLSSQAPHTCNASAQEEGGRQRPTRTTRHTHTHRPDIPHDTRTELLAAAPPPSSQPAHLQHQHSRLPPPVQASAHKDSPSYNLPGAAAPVHSSGPEKTAVECVMLRISLFDRTNSADTRSRGNHKHKWQRWNLSASASSHHVSLACLRPNCETNTN